MAKMGWIVVCAALGAFTGCRNLVLSRSEPVQPKEAVKPVPLTPIAEKKADLDEQTWNPAWNRIVEEALPPELLSRKRAWAVKSLCPRFEQLSDDNRRVFWAYFFQGLAGAEAGLKPGADVSHTEPAGAARDTVTGRTVRSEGLLQLTYMDGQRYGCDFDWEKDKDLPEHDPAKTILQPQNNLLCGVKILDNQLVAQHKPLFSRSSYWSTLQLGRPSFQVFIKQMANVPAFCGARTAEARPRMKTTPRRHPRTGTLH
jgi:hypothetical protein